MAEGKKSFIAYSDWSGTFKAVPDEIAGQLIKYIFSYINDENPKPHENYIVNALFEQIKATLKRDLDKWDKQRKQRSAAGKKSAELRATKSNERSTKSNEKTRNPTVNVNENVNDNEIIDKSITYTEKEFLSNWNEARTYFTGTESNLNKLHVEESNDFKDALNNFKEEDVQKGIKGLFSQKYVPQHIMVFRPKHFLKNIDTYLDAFNNNKKNLYKE